MGRDTRLFVRDREGGGRRDSRDRGDSREGREGRDRDRDRDRDGGREGGREGRGGGSEFRCYNCNRPGHLARDCTEPPRNPLYADTRGTRISDIAGGRDPRDRDRDRDRDRYSRDYDRYGRDYRDYGRDDRDRDRRSYDPRYDRDYRDRDYDRRSPTRYSSSYRDREYSSRRAFSPGRGRSPDRGGFAFRTDSRRSRSPDRAYRGSRSPPRDRARSPPLGASRENGEKEDKPSSPIDGRRTPPDTL